MKLFRYRRPSLKSLLGITKAKKWLKKELVITAAIKPFRAWTNAKRRFKGKIGYESEAGRLVRNGLPTPGGCLVVIVVAMIALIAAITEEGNGSELRVLKETKPRPATSPKTRPFSIPLPHGLITRPAGRPAG
jgi:hypothetical protein